MSVLSAAPLARFVSYVDEAGHSRDPRRTYLCLAGLLARESAWKAFDPEWRAACADEGLSLPFHMADFAARKREFRGWSEERRVHLLGSLLTAIGRAGAIPVGSVVSVRDYSAFPEDVRKATKDPYFMAFQPLTWHIVAAASLEIPPGPVSMVYAYHPEHSRGRGNSQELWEAFRRWNHLLAPFMDSYVSGEPREHTPLQAADLWAYELGHHFERIRPQGKKPRWGFQQFVKMGMKDSFAHDFLTLQDAKGINGLGRFSLLTRWAQIALYTPTPTTGN